jgi:esterase/lipase superfamily enzyme
MRRALVVLLILLTGISLLAQRREVVGQVSDANAKPLPGITVELQLDGKTVSTATTDDDGVFRFDDVDLARGPFAVRFSRQGASVGVIPLTPATTRLTRKFDGISVELRSMPPLTAAPGPPPPPPPPPALPDEKHAIVPVFYATDRERVGFQPVTYNQQRNPEERLHLGRFDVSIPRDVHQTGRAERPNIWTFWREDPDRHLVIVRREEQTYRQFYEEVSGVVAKSARREAFVFVHGFNVGFEDAVYRTAQIAYDLNFDGAPILYSWPSVGTLATYAADVNNSTWTVEHLRWFLEDVAARSGAQAVHLVAHSMGNAPLVRALNEIATRPRSTSRPRFRQVLLTAPDIDVGVFRQLAAAMTSIGERVTLYASANDIALRLSKSYQGGYPRAGDTQPEIVRVAGIDSIDVSSVDTNLIGHFYYAENRSVLSDMMRLIQTGRPPAERCGLTAVGEAARRYWRFVAATICRVEP